MKVNVVNKTISAPGQRLTLDYYGGTLHNNEAFAITVVVDGVRSTLAAASDLQIPGGVNTVTVETTQSASVTLRYFTLDDGADKPLTEGAADDLYREVTEIRFDGRVPGPLITSRGGVPAQTSINYYTGAGGSKTFQMIFPIEDDSPTARLTFANVRAAVGGGPGGANELSDGPYTVKGCVKFYNASIQLIKTVPITFSGSATGTVPALGSLSADPILLPPGVGVGGLIVTNCYVDGANNIPVRTDQWSRFGLVEGLVNGDFSDGSGTFAEGAVFGPVAINGNPIGGRNHGTYILGDSIPSGSGYVGGVGGKGFLLYGLNAAGMPALGFPCAGERASQFINPLHGYVRMGWARGCRYAVCEYGTNDLSDTVDQIWATLISIWQFLAEQGCDVYQTTLAPRTKSLDGWVTAGPGNGTTTGQYAYELGAWSASMEQPVELKRREIQRRLRSGRGQLDSGGALKGIIDSGKTIEVNADGSAIVIGPDGNISNGLGGYWLGADAPVRTGTATAGSATTLTDSSASFGLNAWAGLTLIQQGEYREISANTATQITTQGGNWTSNPTNGTAYVVRGTNTGDGIHPWNPGHVRMAVPVTEWANRMKAV